MDPAWRGGCSLSLGWRVLSLVPLPVYLQVLWGEVELKSPVRASQKERGAVLTLVLCSLCSAAV